MGPSRHTRAAAAASSAGPSGSRNDDASSSSTSALTTSSAQSRTPTRASPYTRTPTKASSALAVVGPSTPTSRTSSPMMLREIFSMISPFRGHSRAKRSAAFGGADDAEEQEQQQQQQAIDSNSNTDAELEDVEEAVGTDDRMIEDAEEGFVASTGLTPEVAVKRNRLDVPASSTGRASRSPSPRPRSSLPAPSKPLPLADSGLVTPGLRRHIANTQPEPFSSTPLASTSYAPPTQTSPVSRNYDLLARFFAEKQRGGQGGLTEVEVEGCIRLIEESMSTGRNLESEFNNAAAPAPASYARQYAPLPASHFAPSSRASSIAPPAMPTSQSMGNLFHPGTSRMPASSSTFSFLAPRASTTAATQFNIGAPAPTTRRRPIYLGPGMSGLSLSRRRPVVASASRAAALRTQPQGGLTRSSTDPNFMRHAVATNDDDEAADRAEDAKRRRTAVASNATTSSQDGASTSDQTMQFEPTYEKQARQSSLLAKDLAASPAKTITSGSPLKRAAPSAEPVAASVMKASPPKVPTRTASAIQDILKTTPPVRPPTKPELVNPYQSSAPLPAKSKKSSAEEDAPQTPVRRSARASMLTRAKARETAKAAEKQSPPKESVLDLIERTAPKTSASKRKAATGQAEEEQQRNAKALSAPKPEQVAAPAASTEPSAEERKLQKTEEVQRRLEALTKAKTQQPSEQQKAPAAAAKPSTANLVPPQYTASKPKKPSPLSAAFQAPDSPSSDSEATTAAPVKPSAGQIKQPSFTFGASAAPAAKTTATATTTTTAPSGGFSFSAPKASTPTAASAAPASSAGGFSFSKPSPAPGAAPSSGFSFTPVSAASQSAPASAPAAAPSASGGFSFSAPKSAAAASASTGTSAVTPPSSLRDEVLSEDASKLPKFEWQLPSTIQAPSTLTSAEKTLREEMKSVAQAALPNFEFRYEIETSIEKASTASSAATVGAAKSSAPANSTGGAGSGGFSFGDASAAKPASSIMGGFSFSAPSPAATSPAPAAAVASTTDSAPTDDSATDNTDPTQPTSSGLLGEGEGEESESTLLTTRCKIWKLDIATKSWKDLGVCIAKLKHNSDTNKHRLLARNEANGKVAVNFMTYKGLTSKLEGTVNTFLGFEGKEMVQFRLKVKAVEGAKEFKDALEGASTT